MPTNVREFSKQVMEFGKTLLPEQFVLFQKKLTFELLSRVVKKTPVDTGRARANWQVDIDTIPQGELDITDKNGRTTINDGLGRVGPLTPGAYQTIYLANNVPYILELENGSSTKAANGMLGVSIEEVEQSFN